MKAEQNFVAHPAIVAATIAGKSALNSVGQLRIKRARHASGGDSAMAKQSHPIPATAEQQRDALFDAKREANEGQPRNFKEDALKDKVVSVEPDGAGPTPTESFDTGKDRQQGSGSGGAGCRNQRTSACQARMPPIKSGWCSM
jgi:hypothetical protein